MITNDSHNVFLFYTIFLVFRDLKHRNQLFHACRIISSNTRQTRVSPIGFRSLHVAGTPSLSDRRTCRLVYPLLRAPLHGFVRFRAEMDKNLKTKKSFPNPNLIFLNSSLYLGVDMIAFVLEKYNNQS